VPAGTCENGLPFGFLINGPRFRDGLVLEVGAMWERAHPWSASAPGYEPFGV
jgi:amidase/aspartyl-tRNA(Asn)/glutamyl-tRNA(Gln) amidotransferase subunit A